MPSQENEQLQTTLLQAHTDIAVLQSELDKLKNMYADQKAQHDRSVQVYFNKTEECSTHWVCDCVSLHRESEDLKRMVAECQSYCNQIQILQQVSIQ